MPLPKPKKDDTLDTFMYRCMDDDTMREEFPNEQQRVAMCARQWGQKD